MNITVQDYDPNWKIQFETLEALLWPAIKNWAKSIEHVGSTSVEGLAAKPVIDIDIVVENFDVLPDIKKALEALGYIHRGDLGIKDRESFKAKNPSIDHHLYVCLDGCVALKNHLVLRDHLKKNTRDREKYSDLKKELALKHPNDSDRYLEGKTGFILDILKEYGFDQSQLNDIEDVNKKRS